ncbi:hypothetical protein DINM_002712 [Dirofilaria immitis]|nr:hypothetical protein [Dirofilaria immitis]
MECFIELLDALEESRKSEDNELSSSSHTNKTYCKQTGYMSKNLVIKEPLSFVLQVCIDFGFAQRMSDKEIGKLVRQMGRYLQYTYVRKLCNRTYIIYIHTCACTVNHINIHTGFASGSPGLKVMLLSPDQRFLCEGRRKISGFDYFSWIISTRNINEFATEHHIIYLSPDSQLKALLDVKSDEVYVIGGLVDETGVGSLSYHRAEELGLDARRLPIQEFLRRRDSGTFNVMLTINQVVEILATETPLPRHMKASIISRSRISFKKYREASNKQSPVSDQSDNIGYDSNENSADGEDIRSLEILNLKTYKDIGLRKIWEEIQPVWRMSDEDIVNLMASRIIYEDEELIAFDKPYQMICSNAPSNQAKLLRILPKLSSRITPHIDCLRIVKSIAKSVTGVILFAKNQNVQERTKALYDNGLLEQYYRVITNMAPERQEASINMLPLDADSSNEINLFLEASTHYRVLKHDPKNHTSYMECIVNRDVPEQIRAHLGIGIACPIIGDMKYNYSRREAGRGIPPRLSDRALQDLNIAGNAFRRLPIYDGSTESPLGFRDSFGAVVARCSFIRRMTFIIVCSMKFKISGTLLLDLRMPQQICCAKLDDQLPGSKSVVRWKTSTYFLVSLLYAIQTEYVKRALLGFLRRDFNISDHKENVYLVIHFREPLVNEIDYKWNYRISSICIRGFQLEKLLWILSTFGGALSAMGDYYKHFAEKAELVSYSQLQLANNIGDPVLISRCKLYISISLMQTNRYHAAAKLFVTLSRFLHCRIASLFIMFYIKTSIPFAGDNTVLQRR